MIFYCATQHKCSERDHTEQQVFPSAQNDAPFFYGQDNQWTVSWQEIANAPILVETRYDGGYDRMKRIESTADKRQWCKIVFCGGCSHGEMNSLADHRTLRKIHVDQPFVIVGCCHSLGYLLCNSDIEELIVSHSRVAKETSSPNFMALFLAISVPGSQLQKLTIWSSSWSSPAFTLSVKLFVSMNDWRAWGYFAEAANLKPSFSHSSHKK